MEPFGQSASHEPGGLGELIVGLVVLVVGVLLISIIGKYFWNNALAPLISGINPTASGFEGVWQMVGLWIILALFLPITQVV
tara:strand:+ start:277 stop:522 length:246 start_codon:yes stop_codon:yes gene_type:complete